MLTTDTLQLIPVISIGLLILQIVVFQEVLLPQSHQIIMEVDGMKLIQTVTMAVLQQVIIILTEALFRSLFLLELR